MIGLLKGRYDSLKAISGPLAADVLVDCHGSVRSRGEQIVDFGGKHILLPVADAVRCDAGIGIEEQVPFVLYLAEVGRPILF